MWRLKIQADGSHTFGLENMLLLCCMPAAVHPAAHAFEASPRFCIISSESPSVFGGSRLNSNCVPP